MRPMTFRNRIFITVALVCHLFLTPGWLISQLRPGVADGKQAASSEGGNGGTTPGATVGTAVMNPVADGPNGADPLPIKPAGEPVTIKAREQEKIGDLFKLRGEVEVDFRQYKVTADEMTYDDLSGEVTATGNVIFSGGPHDERISASNGHYNVITDTGKFFNVTGSTGAKLRGRGVVLTSSNPFIFSGKEVEQQGRDKIVVRHGRVTSCKLPKPKWTFNAGQIVVVAGAEAKLYNSTFHLFGLPIFYFPFVEHPVERLSRQTGFLLPHLGNSTTKGFTAGEGFYWAINRSMDATLGLEYYSRRGWAQRADFRWRPSDSSFVNFSFYGVEDRGVPTTQTIFVPGVGAVTVPKSQKEGGQEARLNAESPLPFGFRGVASIDYLNQYIFRVIFSERFTEAINSEAKSIAFASKNDRGYSFNVMSARYQNFQSTEPGDVITIVHAPGFESSSVERKVGATPFYYSYDSSLEGVSRRELNFVTANVVGRFDLEPTLSMPLHWKGWDIRPEAILHETYYTERLLPSSTGIGSPAAQPVNRRAMEAVFEVRPPALSKIFARAVLGRKIKHVLEPRFNYRMVTGVNNFESILRFDERDVLSNTNEMEYGLVNRIYSKAGPKPGCPANDDAGRHTSKTDQGRAAQDFKAARQEVQQHSVEPGCENAPAREVVSWEVAQKYFFDPTFGGALVPGRRNVFTTSADFTGIAFLTEPRRFSPIISRLRVYAPGKADIDWQLDYDLQKGRINASTVLVNYHFLNQFTFGAGHAFLQTPGEVLVSQPIVSPLKFNQFRLQLNYGNPNRRGLNAATLAGFDANEGFLQYSAVQTSYNWDCCGITVEYRRFNFGGRDESQYRFALTLANLGTFGTLRKQERLF